jgi:hypothetical protein
MKKPSDRIKQIIVQLKYDLSNPYCRDNHANSIQAIMQYLDESMGYYISEEDRKENQQQPTVPMSPYNEAFNYGIMRAMEVVELKEHNQFTQKSIIASLKSLLK